MSVRIDHVRVLDPASGFDAITTICIQGGEILSIGAPPADFDVRRVVDGRALWAFPGLIDLSARLREPGLEHKATIASETAAAAASGITTVVVPPDTTPAIDTPAEVELITRKAKRACGVRVLTIGAATIDLAGEQLTEMASLKNAGVLAIGQGHHAIARPLILRRVMEYAATFDLPLVLTPEDRSLAGRGCAHEGPVATRLGLPGIPQAAETAALGVILALVEQTGARVIVGPLSCARSVDMIERAKNDGLPVQAFVAAHQLFLCDVDTADLDPILHVRPPLRTQLDREALRAGLARGVIDSIVSDHQPHEIDSKLGPFAETQPGISALETLLPLTLKWAAEEGIDTTEALSRVTIAPARALGLSGGRLAAGERADFVLFDPAGRMELSQKQWRSKGLNSPFLGWEFDGRVCSTWIAGREVFQKAPDHSAPTPTFEPKTFAD
ncbi:MAG: dihydroorotase [Thioalkalivibrionaceae bacterium]